MEEAVHLGMRTASVKVDLDSDPDSIIQQLSSQLLGWGSGGSLLRLNALSIGCLPPPANTKLVSHASRRGIVPTAAQD